MDHHHAHGPAKGVHNMAVVGRHRIFLSHLPMFMAPHDSQVILEAHFVKQGKNVDGVYFADRAANPAVRFYTLSPEPFVLQELFQGDSTHPPRTQFKATVFRGHLEKGGEPIDRLTNIDVEVKVVHAHGFAGTDKGKTLTYVMFGEEPELMLAHFVSKAPDFDQILAVSATGALPPADEMERGPMVDIPQRGNLVKDRLQTKDTSAGRCHSVGAHQMRDLHLTVQAELYFEEGELSSSAFTSEMMNQTKAEKAAGFD